MDVFQRSPEWLFDHKGYRAPYPPQVTWLDRNLPYHTNFMRFRTHWLTSPYLSGPLREIDPTFEHPHARSAVNKRLRDERIAFIEQKFAEPARTDREDDPGIPPVLRRPVQVDSDYCYYDALCATTSRWSPTGSSGSPRTGIRDRWTGPSTSST